jgi:hypothetical protein
MLPNARRAVRMKLAIKIRDPTPRAPLREILEVNGLAMNITLCGHTVIFSFRFK